MMKSLHIEYACAVAVKFDQVDRREVAGGVVEEHVLRARIGRVDSIFFWTGMPLIDRGIELESRISTRPCSFVNNSPQVTSF